MRSKGVDRTQLICIVIIYLFVSAASLFVFSSGPAFSQ
jgi:hypothetical protein